MLAIEKVIYSSGQTGLMILGLPLVLYLYWYIAKDRWIAQLSRHRFKISLSYSQPSLNQSHLCRWFNSEEEGSKLGKDNKVKRDCSGWNKCSGNTEIMWSYDLYEWQWIAPWKFEFNLLVF